MTALATPVAGHAHRAWPGEWLPAGRGVVVAMVNGFGFPRYRGGAMWWARQQEPARLAALTAAVARAADDPDQAGLVRLVLDNG